MNNEQKLAKYRDSGLMPFQARLVLDVLSAALPVRHLLVADPGTGRSRAVIFLASEIANGNLNYRILIIGPSSLMSMYEYELNRAMPSNRVMFINRRSLRELEAETAKGSSPWPPASVVIMSIDTARQDEVLNELRSTAWDLVVLEEVHRCDRARWTLLKTMMKEAAFMRLLMITATPELKPIASLLKGAQRTEWSLPTLEDWEGKKLLRMTHAALEVVTYRRSEAEIVLLKEVVALSAVASQTPAGQMVCKMIQKQASSSPLALEQTVRRLRNSLAHGVPEFLAMQGDDVPNEESDAPSSSAPWSSIWRDKATALTALTHLLAQIESLSTDRKRQALEALLDRLQRAQRKGDHSIGVFCVARTTANYLRTLVAERQRPVWLLTSEMAPGGFETSLQGFTSGGGVLICTTTALQGVELRGTEAFIHYDPPTSASEWAIRLSRAPDAVNYLLSDESKALPDEWAFAQKAPSIGLK